MNRLFLFIVLMAWMLHPAYGQSGLVAEYDMNNCQLSNSLSNADGAIFGGNLCICGAESNGISFDGIFTEATFDS